MVSKNKILAIDTTNPEKTAILLADKNGRIIDKKIWQPKEKQSEELLSAIEKLLRAYNSKPQDLFLLIVNRGPGSFTGTRVGVAAANGLSFALNIPVVGVKGKDTIENILRKGYEEYSKNRPRTSTIVKPIYAKPPNITQPKK